MGPDSTTITRETPALPAQVSSDAVVGGVSRRLAWGGAALVALPALVVYLATLEPSVYYVDSGVFLATVKDFGVGYSPGFPLYVMAAWLWTLLTPFVPVARSVNAFSAVAAAAAAVAIFWATFHLLSAPASPEGKKGKGEKEKASREEKAGSKRRDLTPRPPSLRGKGEPSRTLIPPALPGQAEPSRTLIPPALPGQAELASSRTPPSLAGKGVGGLGSRQALGFVAAVLAGWLAAFAYTVWSQAINAAVFTFHGLFAALMLYVTIRLGQAGRVGPNPTSAQRRLALALIGAWGLGWAVHYASVGFGPFMLLLTYRHRAWLRNRPLVRQGMGAFLLTGALPYLYGPIRSAAWPVVDWGHVATPANWLLHLTGANWTTDSSNFRLVGSESFLQQVAHWGELTLFQFVPVAIVAVLGGWYCLWRWHRPLFWPLLLFYLGPVAVALTYVTNNGESYLVPAHLTLALLAAVGTFHGVEALGRALERQGSRGASRTNPVASRPAGSRTCHAERSEASRNVQGVSSSVARPFALLRVTKPGHHAGPVTSPWVATPRRIPDTPLVLLAIALLLAGATVYRNYPELDRHDSYALEEYGKNAFGAVPRNGIMLVPGDNLNASVLYLQVVLDYRPDVMAIPESLVHFDWWRASFRHHHPDVHLPEIPLDSVPDDEEWMTQLVAGLLDGNPGRPLYFVTLKGKRLPDGHTAVPAGIGYRLVPNGDQAAFQVQRSDWAFTFQNPDELIRPTFSLQRAYNVARREVQLAYVQAYQNLGDVDFNRGDFRLAAESYATALQFAPSHPELRLGLGASLAKSGRAAEALQYLPPDQQRPLAAASGSPTDQRIQAAFGAAWNALGSQAHSRGNPRRALQSFRMAYTLNPLDPETLANLGALLAMQGDPLAALAYLQQGIQLAPTNARLYFNLGQVYDTLQNRPLSEEMFQKAFALDPSLRRLLTR